MRDYWPWILIHLVIYILQCLYDTVIFFQNTDSDAPYLIYDGEIYLVVKFPLRIYFVISELCLKFDLSSTVLEYSFMAIMFMMYIITWPLLCISVPFIELINKNITVISDTIAFQLIKFWIDCLNKNTICESCSPSVVKPDFHSRCFIML